jgi:decaheme cytochrome c component MtrC/MtrF-like protein/class III cytochrome C family protein
VAAPLTRRPRRAALAVATVATRVLVFVLALAALAGPGAAQSTRFLHRPHLDARFRDETGNGACTKCHSFEGEGADAYLTPYRRCESCHAATEAARNEHLIRGNEGKLEERPAGDVPFRHSAKSHAALACLSCHAPVESNAGHDVDFAVARDLKQCSKCHSDHAEDAEKNRALRSLLTKPGVDSCSNCHLTGASDAARTRNRKSFLHRDHLSHDDRATDGWTAGVCARCHRRVIEAGPIQPDNYASLFLGPGDAGKSCGDCHKDQTGKLASLAWEQSGHDKIATRFSHKVHVAQPELKNCATCHAPSTAGEPQTAGNYEACVACHQHVQNRVEHHGEAAGCQRCHQNPGPTSPETAAIATVTVKREHAEGFILATHAHPGVTVAGGPLPEENCSSCHRGTPAALLRPRARRFDHADHLGKTPTKDDCLKCHKNVVTTADNQFVRAYDDPAPGSGLACEECHKGSDFSSKLDTHDVKVPRFSHRSHLASTKRTLSCDDCHRSDAAQPGIFAIPGPEKCRDCHNHNVDGKRFPGQPDYSAFTGGRETAEAQQKCGYCHAPDPKQGFTEIAFAVQRSSGRLEPGKQWHDRGGGCAQCHGLAQAGPLVEPLTDLHIQNPHNHPKLDREPFNRPPLPDGSNCAVCHTGDQVGRFLRRTQGARK